MTPAAAPAATERQVAYALSLLAGRDLEAHPLPNYRMRLAVPARYGPAAFGAGR